MLRLIALITALSACFCVVSSGSAGETHSLSPVATSNRGGIRTYQDPPSIVTESNEPFPTCLNYPRVPVFLCPLVEKIVPLSRQLRTFSRRYVAQYAMNNLLILSLYDLLTYILPINLLKIVWLMYAVVHTSLVILSFFFLAVSNIFFANVCNMIDQKRVSLRDSLNGIASDAECPICLEKLKDTSAKLWIEPCCHCLDESRHIYHLNCYEKMLKSSPWICPVCRYTNQDQDQSNV